MPLSVTSADTSLRYLHDNEPHGEVIVSQDYPTQTSVTTYPPEPSDYPTILDTETSGQDASTTDVAKEQAGNVGKGAADAGQHVAGVAKDQASNVATEATTQAKNLLGQTSSELRDQAAAQQQRIAGGIHSLSSELASMADRSQESGTATDLVRQASQRTEQIASWLDERDPGSLVQEVSSFARRRPGAFLAIAAGAGLLAGRLTRGAVDATRDDSPSTGSSTVPATRTPTRAPQPPTVAETAGVYVEPISYDPLYPDGRPL
jgi:hypothetical protein